MKNICCLTYPLDRFIHFEAKYRLNFVSGEQLVENTVLSGERKLLFDSGGLEVCV